MFNGKVADGGGRICLMQALIEKSLCFKMCCSFFLMKLEPFVCVSQGVNLRNNNHNQQMSHISKLLFMQQTQYQWNIFLVNKIDFRKLFN